MEKVCERCGASPGGPFGLLDYCAECSRDLCDACMAKRCCGHVPALSGNAEDADDVPDDDCCPGCGACPGFIGAECDGDCDHARSQETAGGIEP
jgi:hypothetical protein